ncbi:hypothetical protein BH24ACT5_BH24ACT5_06730 [soil metagenome]
MFVLYVIVAIVLSLALAVSAAGKLTKMEQVVTMMTGVGVPVSWFPMLAAAQLAGAAGLLIGLGVAGLGIAAAIGIVVYFAGAISFHVRAGDRNIGPPAGLLVLGVIALIARIASA